MKKFLITVMVLLPLHIYSTTELLITTTKIEPDIITLKITIKSDEDIDKEYLEQFKRDIEMQIKNDENVVIEPKPMPRYINDIINLINTEESRKKALEIYNNNNLYLEQTSSTSVNIINGKKKQTGSYNYKVILRVLTNKNHLVINPFIFTYKNEVFKSKKLIIR